MTTSSDQLDVACGAITKASQGKYNKAIMAVQKCKDLVAELAAEEEIGAFLMYSEALGHLQQCIQYLTHAKPKCLCRFCGGFGADQTKTCQHRKGHGWMPTGVAKEYEKQCDLK